MKKEAIINGNQVILSEEDKAAGEEFHKKRYAFAWIKGKLTFNDNLNDDRDHQHWMLEDYEVSIEEWEVSPRGYMLPDRIQLFIGSHFSKLNTSEISITDFNELLFKHHERYNSTSVTVYNGVKVGKIGDIWEPLILLGTYNT